MEYEPVIGLEVHLELNTKTKMFCGCTADHFGAPPNSLTCPICLGMPGSLPMPNHQAIEWTVLLGIALNCHIPEVSKFDRKHYFYPDLAKGYQISQYDEPLCVNGQLKLDISEQKTESAISIRRVHLEEDTGKLIHTRLGKKNVSLIDFNRSGVPLVEIVTEPEIKSVEELLAFAKELRRMVRYLGISMADMEKGQMRFEANISLRQKKESLPDYKVEIKNINSFRFLRQSVSYEIERQKELLSKGKRVVQETRGWDEKSQKTVSQRFKEEAEDYRYFPEPDIPPIRWDKKDLEPLKGSLPELPREKRQRFRTWFHLSKKLASVLTDDPYLADWYEEALRAYVQTAWPGIDVSKTEPTQPVAIDAYSKNLANWVLNELMRHLKSLDQIKKLSIEPASLAELLYLVDKDQLTQNKAKEILAMMVKSGRPPRSLMKELKAEKLDSERLNEVVSQVLEDNQKAVNDFQTGKSESLQYLIGQVMRLSEGTADPNQVKRLILEILGDNH